MSGDLSDLPSAGLAQEISAQELATLLQSQEPPLLIDVREPFELASGAIPGAVNMPMSTVPERLAELPRDRPIVTYCHIGERSWVVAQFLLRRGFRDIKSLRGGIEAWSSLGATT